MNKAWVRTMAGRFLLLMVIMAIWEMLPRLNITTDFFISRPSLLYEWFMTNVPKPLLWIHFGVTLRAAGIGIALGSLAGVLCGFALGQWNLLYELLDPFLMALYTLPRIALAPLFILWFGIGEAPKVALAVSLVFFVLLYNTYVGTRSVDRDLVNAVRTMGGSRLFVLRHVVLSSVLPYIFGGLRISLGLGLIGTIAGEMLAGRYGVGQIILRAANLFDTTGTFSVLIILAILGVLLNTGMRRLEAYLMRWRAPVEFL